MNKELLNLIECGLQSPDCLMKYLLDFEQYLRNGLYDNLADEIIKLKLKHSKVSFAWIKQNKEKSLSDLSDFEKLETIYAAMEDLMKGAAKIPCDIKRINDALIYLNELKRKCNEAK